MAVRLMFGDFAHEGRLRRVKERPMPVKAIFPVLAVVFLLLALFKITREGGKLVPAARTWLLISAIFAAVSIYLITATP